MAPNEQLKRWMAEVKIKGPEAARRAEYDRGNFHRILEGQAKPTIELAARIETMTDGRVSIADWIGFTPTRSADAKAAA